MVQKTKVIIGVVVFALVIAGAYFAYNALVDRVKPQTELTEGSGLSAQPPDAPPPVEQAEDDVQEDTSAEPEKIKAPDFTVVDADGNSVKLSDMEGKPVVLNFWASWCPPCKAEMPEFDKVFTELGEDVTFMMVDATDGQRETKEIGEKYVADQGFSFPVYFDTAQEAVRTYGIRAYPTTIFIDKDGYVITGAEGQLNEETLRYGISLIQGD